MYSWRSLIFVPADNRRLIEKAATKSADAVILDLEDAVSDANKDTARCALQENIELLKSNGSDVCVRVNSPLTEAVRDVDAALCRALDAFVVPKTNTSENLEALTASVANLVSDDGVRFADTPLIPLIESAAAMPALFDIASFPSVIGLAFGVEDFSLGMGVEPELACLELPSKMISLAAASRSLMSLAVPASIADFSSIDTYRSAAEISKAYGVNGAICIHPNQVAVANETFGPSSEQLRHAQQVIDVWQAAIRAGESVAVLDGVMIDKPVVLRAKNTLTLGDLQAPSEDELFPRSTAT